MKPWFALVAWIAALLAGQLCTPAAHGHELSGYIEGEMRFFPNAPLCDDQQNNNASLALQPEYYHELKSGSSFTFVPFVRLDSADSRRTHVDIRELNFLYLAERWELTVGIDKVFWGVTEFHHLVDIINQTDLVEALDGEQKLGQHMVHFSVPADWGTLDFFILPWFREMTFPGPGGRLRLETPVDTDHPLYESPAGQSHLDFALRYNRTIGNTDFGIYHFSGTGREPGFLPAVTPAGGLVLRPFYQIIQQTGIDLQTVAGQWLWKLEALHRSGQGPAFFAATGGFEYTFVAVGDTAMDVGLLAEYAYDERGNRAGTFYQNDAMFGLRLTANDAASSEVLIGAILDLENGTKLISIQGSRRIGDRVKLTIDAGFFIDPDPQDILFDLRRDDFLRLQLAVFF